MRSVDRDALVAYFGTLNGPNTVAITDVQAVIENWPAPDHIADPGKMTIEDVWEDFNARLGELVEFAPEHTEEETASTIRELLWELIARVLLVAAFAHREPATGGVASGCMVPPVHGAAGAPTAVSAGSRPPRPEGRR